MKFAFIQAEKASFPVGFMCEQLAVSRSGFYAAQKREASPRQQTDGRHGHAALLAIARNDRRIEQLTRIVAVHQRHAKALGVVFQEQLQATLLETLSHERVHQRPQLFRRVPECAQHHPLGRRPELPLSAVRISVDPLQ